MALEATLKSRAFLVGIRVCPARPRLTVEPLVRLARRVDLWLESLDPETTDPSLLRTEIVEPEVLLEVHAIPKDPQDRTRRAHPIVWNPVPLEGPWPPGDGGHLPRRRVR